MVLRLGFVVACALAAFGQNANETVASPDGRVAFTVQTDSASGGQLSYQVSFEGKPLIGGSKLGLDLEGQRVLGPAVRIVSAERTSTDDTYNVVTGKANPIRNHYNAMRVMLQETAGAARSLVLEARAYDDGVAFRYVVPQQNSIRTFRLAKEITQFRFLKDATAYPLFLKNYHTSFENVYAKLVLTRIPTGQLMGVPLLVEVPGVAWVGIAEADNEDYAGMYLVHSAERGSTTMLEAQLSPNVEEPDLAVSGSLPHHSPWRALMIGREPGRLIESNMIMNLNPPSAIADTSWIKPGKTAWDWWSGSSGTGSSVKGGMNTETMKYFADFAAQSGFEYLLIDAGWSAEGDVTKMNPEVDVPDIVRYAGAKGVKVWLWLHWTQADRQMDEAFPLYEKWGIAGVKIDFMDSNDQRIVRFYHRAAKTAADHHLMVDFHGAYPPTGMQRKYPNVLTHEGVLGLEYNKWSAVPDPDHNTMLPFTRMLAGPMDYTPGGFDNRTKADFEARNHDPMVMGTRAHQLALYVVLESPLQMVADRPSAYKDQPAFEFIRNVPTTWNETRVLAGEPGKYVVIARRHGDAWFVGAITNWSAREVNVPLSFLADGEYAADVFADATDSDRYPKNVSIQRARVNRAGSLHLRLAEGGGYAVRLTPARR